MFKKVTEAQLFEYDMSTDFADLSHVNVNAQFTEHQSTV